jgi:hypothetical protein
MTASWFTSDSLAGDQALQGGKDHKRSSPDLYGFDLSILDQLPHFRVAGADNLAGNLDWHSQRLELQVVSLCPLIVTGIHGG